MRGERCGRGQRSESLDRQGEQDHGPVDRARSLLDRSSDGSNRCDADHEIDLDHVRGIGSSRHDGYIGSSRHDVYEHQRQGERDYRREKGRQNNDLAGTHSSERDRRRDRSPGRRHRSGSRERERRHCSRSRERDFPQQRCRRKSCRSTGPSQDSSPARGDDDSFPESRPLVSIPPYLIPEAAGSDEGPEPLRGGSKRPAVKEGRGLPSKFTLPSLFPLPPPLPSSSDIPSGSPNQAALAPIGMKREKADFSEAAVSVKNVERSEASPRGSRDPQPTAPVIAASGCGAVGKKRILLSFGDEIEEVFQGGSSVG